MTEFLDLTLESAVRICLNMRQMDMDCLNAVIGDVDPESFAAERWRLDGPAWAVYQDGVPVLIGGIALVTPWVGIAWMVAANGITRHTWKKVIEFSRKVLSNASRRIQRIEAHVLASWPAAEKYAERLGFTPAGVKKRAARDGMDVLEFAIIGGEHAHN